MSAAPPRSAFAGGRTLIVNADDLGMSDGVSRGIVEAHLEGIVTSTTAMTNLPASRTGIELALREAPKLGLGLHVNLTYGRPLLPPDDVPSLVDASGHFVSVQRGVGTPHRWNRRDVTAELGAQFDRFVAYAGRTPDHLDAHQLVSTVSVHGRQVVLELAAEHGLPVRRGRTGWFGAMERWIPVADDLPDALQRLADRLPRPWRQGPMAQRTPLSTDGLDLRFFGERATVRTLLRILDTLPEGVTEMVCHPGRGGDGDDYRHREAELAALTDPRIRARVEADGVRLATFGVLTGEAQAA